MAGIIDAMSGDLERIKMHWKNSGPQSDWHMAAYAYIHEWWILAKKCWEDIQKENYWRLYSWSYGWSVHWWKHGISTGVYLFHSSWKEEFFCGGPYVQETQTDWCSKEKGDIQN